MFRSVARRTGASSIARPRSSADVGSRRRPISRGAANTAFPTPYTKKMTHSEAFVESMAAHGVTNVFGIVGSAFMDALDIFPQAGIRFISVQHEQNAGHMADGYARVTGKHGVCVGQNGPGISNIVTGIAAAYFNHAPVVIVTPEAGTMTKGYGGFQEIEQLPMFSSITKAQVNVNNANRMAEWTSRAFDLAMLEQGPVQLNIARDYFYGETEHTIRAPNKVERPAGGPESIRQAVELLLSAENPVIVSGAGVDLGGGLDAVRELAEYLGTPVISTYLHNDSFPASHPLSAGPLGYQGSQAAMYSIKDADVVVALGTRLGPFGTLPQYGLDYFPANAKIVQADIDKHKLGLVKPVDVPIHGDAGLVASAILASLKARSNDIKCLDTKAKRAEKLTQLRAQWKEELDRMTFSDPPSGGGKIKPREALRELEKAMPANAMVSSDIGNLCSVSNSYLKFEQGKSHLAAGTFGNCGYAFPAAMGAKVGRPDRPAIAYVGDGAWGMSLNEVLTCVRENIPTTAVVFNNRQWGAEKKNQVLWFGDRYIGSNLKNPSFAEVARAMGAEGISVTSPDQVGDALLQSVKNQEEGKTTVLEVNIHRELGDPFRRDAMKLAQRSLDRYKVTNETSESATGQPVDISG